MNSGQVLERMLKDPKQREHLLVVDVRGRDWVGGHIPSSINLRTTEVVTHPDALLLKCGQNRVHHIIFTCMYSVLRARKCAIAVQQQQAAEQRASNSAYRIPISLLAGGMHAWVNQFADVQAGLKSASPKDTLIDNFDPEMWSDGGPSQGGLVHVMDALWSEGGQKALSDALTQELDALLFQQRRGSNAQSAQTSRRSSNSEANFAQPR